VEVKQNTTKLYAYQTLPAGCQCTAQFFNIT